VSGVASLAYLLCCAWMADPLYRLIAGGDAGAVGRLGQVLCGFVCFFGGFFVLGAVEVLHGPAWLDVEHALVPMAAVALLLGAARLQRLTAITAPAAFGAIRAAGRPGRVAWLVVLGFAIMLATTLAQYPRGYEALAYHLPIAVHMMQNHSIQPWDPVFPHTFPANASLLYAFWLRFLPERIVAAENFVFVAIAACALRRLTLQLGADRRAADIVACGFVTVPMIAFAAGELYSDLGGLAFLAVAAVFALEARRPRHWLLCGLSMGLAFGFKSLHLIPIGFFALCAFASGWRGGRLSAAVNALGAFALGVLLMAGVWLLRNYMDYGNPLYPVSPPLIGRLLGWPSEPETDLMGRNWTQFEWVSDPALWPLYPWFEWQKFGQNFKFSAGLGAFFAAAVPVSLVVALVACLRQGWRSSRRLLLLSATVLVIVAAWWAMGDRQPRYLLGAVLLAMPLAGWLLAGQAPARRRAFEWLFGTCIVVMLAVAVSAEMLKFGDRIILSKQTTRTAFYEYPDVIDRLPPGSTILNLGERPWHYALLGAGLQNRVISTPMARKLFGLPPGLGGIESVALRAEPLRRLHVDYVFSDGAVVTNGACMLQEVYRQSVNPLNGVPLPKPRVLYRVRDCDAGGQT